MSFYPRRLPPMNRSNRHPTTLGSALVAALALLALLAAPSAHAGSSEQIVKECIQQGSVDPGAHSREELKGALRELPSDISEYTDCYDVIADALDAKRQKRERGSDGSAAPAGGAGGGGGGSGGGGPSSEPKTLEERGRTRNEIESTLLRPAPKVKVAGKAVEPELDGFEVASSNNNLPLPILLVLVAVALTFAGGGAVALWSKLPALRRMLGRGPAS